MPKRTLGLETIRYRPGRNRKNTFGDLTDIDGYDLLHLFRAWAASLDPDELVDHTLGRYLKVTNVSERGRSVIVEAESGVFGDLGKTIDVYSHEVAHQRAKHQSATVMTRLVFTLPPLSDVGMFSVERQGNVGAGTRLVEAFRKALNVRFSNHSFSTETVLEQAAWTDGAKLLAVTAVAYSVPLDLGDGITGRKTPLGRFEQKLEPERGQNYLPAGLLKALRNKKITAADFLGFPNNVDVDDTFVTVSRDGREKTFNIEKERVPAIRLVLNTDREPTLGDTEFFAKCQDEVKYFLVRMGYSWDEQWQAGRWTKSALDVTMTNPAAG